MDKRQSGKNDLEARVTRFALDVRVFVRSVPRSIIATEDGKQLVRASGSIGANYIEACESLSKKDFLHRIKIARKEAREARYWLNMFDTVAGSLAKDRDRLSQEAGELLKILSSIANRG